MHPESPRWKAITPSHFPWERQALEYVREGLPDHEPYRVWSNFEFVPGDGSINEVDLLALTPGGFYLIEIKSWQGAISGDAGTWIRQFEGKETVVDNPVLLANRKAKRLKSLLQKQGATRKIKIPFLEAIVFLSATDLHVDLDRTGRQGVWIRDDKVDADDPDSPPGILSQLKETHPGGRRRSITSKQARALTRAMDSAGIRKSQKARRFGDYRLDELIYDGENYQDWVAHHGKMEKVKRRVRIFGVGSGTSAPRETVARAARRELQILEGIEHPGIMRPRDYKEHDLGPALLFDHHPKGQRLDHYLKEHGGELSFDRRLDLFRQIGEILQVAHEKHLYHRVLSPQSILVVDPEKRHPELRIFNWQTGVRESATTTTGRSVTGTAHPDQLVESAATAYMAPEVRLDVHLDEERADVFSLGAIGYHLFTGEPPAANGFELHKKLQESAFGLRPAAAADGIPVPLDELIAFSTSAKFEDRYQSIEEVLDELEAVEDELTSPDADAVDEPEQATVGDLLQGGFRVLKRLGQGGSSIAFLVERDEVEREEEPRVLKLARSDEHNSVLRNEAEVLEKLRHANIVEIFDTVEIYNRFGLLLAPVGLDRRRSEEGKREARTLANILRGEGRLSMDLLQRFGEDLLLTIKHLEEQGIPHRDIKPENLGIEPMGANDTLHLVLFDFSLARAPMENIHVGTRPYLDPFLEERPQERWDLAAERFAAGMTLHEMATGTLPSWGDGKTAPQFTEGEAKIASDNIAAELREPLTEFFARALRRDASERFDNADDMYRAWSQAFARAEGPALPETVEAAEEERAPAARAQLDTQVIELGLSTRAVNALDRLGVETVKDLLTASLSRFSHQKGVGDKTRKEVVKLVRELRERFPEVEEAEETVQAEPEPSAEREDAASLSVDALVDRLLSEKDRSSKSTGPRAIRLYLGLEADRGLQPWCTQAAVSETVDVTRARIGQIVAKYRKRWSKLPALTTLRTQMAEILDHEGRVMTGEELTRAVLAARGSRHEGEERRRRARAGARAALEVERTLDTPRWIERRTGEVLLVARTPDPEEALPSAQALADYAKALGTTADELAARDPLPSPSVVIQALQDLPEPDGASPLAHSRLVELAAAASQSAAASPRHELYPRDLPAGRAIALSAASLLSAAELTPKEIRRRVASRFPEAQPAPGRPELDELLREAGLELAWDPEANDGKGAYRPPRLPYPRPTTTSYTRITRTPRAGTPAQTSAAEEFEERLERARKQGRYLLLVVSNPKNLEPARVELAQRFDLEAVSLDRLLLDALRTSAEEAGAKWQVVVEADAADRDSQSWRNLQNLLDRALLRVEKELLSRTGTVLLTHPGLLARYDRLDFLERFRDAVGPDREAPLGLWVLVPGDERTHRPHLDGKEVPTVTPGEWARVPGSWPSTLNATRSSLTQNPMQTPGG